MRTWEEFWEEHRHSRSMPYSEVQPNGRGLNLGCGNCILEGFDNVDIHDAPGVLQMDLTKIPWDLVSNDYDHILVSHFLEHIPHRVEGVDGHFFWTVLEEMARVSKDGAVWEVHGPDPVNAFDDLQAISHTRLVGPRTFRPFVNGNDTRALSVMVRVDKWYLEPLDYTEFRSFQMGPIHDWHFKRYLGPIRGNRILRLIGRPCNIRMVYRFHKMGA